MMLQQPSAQHRMLSPSSTASSLPMMLDPFLFPCFRRELLLVFVGDGLGQEEGSSYLFPRASFLMWTTRAEVSLLLGGGVALLMPRARATNRLGSFAGRALEHSQLHRFLHCHQAQNKPNNHDIPKNGIHQTPRYCLLLPTMKMRQESLYSRRSSIRRCPTRTNDDGTVSGWMATLVPRTPGRRSSTAAYGHIFFFARGQQCAMGPKGVPSTTASFSSGRQSRSSSSQSCRMMDTTLVKNQDHARMQDSFANQL